MAQTYPAQFASTTNTAAGIVGSAYILPGKGLGSTGIWLALYYSAASTSSGAGAATYCVQQYEPSTTSWNDLVYFTPIVLSTTAQTGKASPNILVKPSNTATQIRLYLKAITGTGATVTSEGDWESAQQ